MRFRPILAAAIALLTGLNTWAQPLLVDGDVCLDIEVVAIHTEGDLAGMTTYRLYATLPGPADIVTTVFGDIEHPTSLQTTTNFYQNDIGSQFPCANNPILFDAFPDLEWDSWLTIGISGPPNAGLGQDCPQVVMSSGSPFVTEFENGQGFDIDDPIGSAWFVVPSNTNGLPDAEGRVLLAQLTTDGDLSGVLYMQVLPGGIGTLAEIVELPLYGPCDELTPTQCPEEIFAVEGGCTWGFEVSSFQPGEFATWTFGDDVVTGGHYANYTFAGDGTYPVSVTFSSEYCPQGVTLATTVEVDDCSEPDCNLALSVQTAQEGEVIMVVPSGYPEGVELVYSLNGEVFMTGGTAVTLPEGTANGPWQLCVQYISEDCPDGVVACTGSEDYESGCPQEIWVGGAECEYVLSICDFTEGEEVSWSFSDGTVAEGHFTWHTFPADGVYEACATYVSPSCPDSTVLCTEVVVEGCSPDPCPLEVEAEWSEAGEGNWVLTAMGVPEGVGVVWYGPGGDIIGDDLVLDYSGGGPVCATYAFSDCPDGVEVCLELGDPPVDCAVELFVTELSTCGAFLVQYEGEPGPGDVTWTMNGNVVQTGGGAFDILLDEGVAVEICAVAVGADCPGGEEACVELSNGGCGGCPEEGTIGWEGPLDGTDCMMLFELGLDGEPDIQAVEWSFGDGFGFTGNTFVEHQYPEPGTYEVCATVLVAGCPEGLTVCAEVVVEDCISDCTPVTVTFTPADGIVGAFNWVMFGEEWAQDGVFWISPEGTPVVQDFCLPDGCFVVDFFALNGSAAAAGVEVTLSGPDGPMDFHEAPFVDDNGWQVFSFGVGETGCDPVEPECTLEIEAEENPDGSWTLTAVTDSEEDVDFLWWMSDGSVLNGMSVDYTFVSGAEVETACVSAVFPSCGEVLNACIDLENGGSGGCALVEVVIEGETLDELLVGLEMAWTLFGDGFDFSGVMSLDPELDGLEAIVLCLPPGCYGMSMDISGVPGLQGLPGMTLTLNIGEEEEMLIDLAVLGDVLTMEFGVQADCGTGISPIAAQDGEGLALFPNPAASAVFVHLDEAFLDGAVEWTLMDGLGRTVLQGATGESEWMLHVGQLAPGGYLLHAHSGAHKVRKRLMVAR